jgi:large subunit ribosomal protein L36e
MTKESIYKRKNSGVAVGLNRGYIVKKRVPAERPISRKGVISDRVKLIRGVIREVSGWAPYERRIMEILRGGGNNPTKRAWRFAKKRVSCRHAVI